MKKGKVFEGERRKDVRMRGTLGEERRGEERVTLP